MNNQMKAANENTTTITESAVRRKARRRLWSPVRYREDRQWFAQYGPYALVEEPNMIRFHGLNITEAS